MKPDDSVAETKKLELALAGRKIPGFFPTPAPVIDRMLAATGLLNGHGEKLRILEPQAGKGDIADTLKERLPGSAIVTCEMQSQLAEILKAKKHQVHHADFFTLSPEELGYFDRVVMNPPFEKGADMEHVRHAFNFLKDDGVLVSVMSAGVFFREDNKTRQFREWYADLDHEVIDLPDRSFEEVGLIRKTGVSTKLLVIHKS